MMMTISDALRRKARIKGELKTLEARMRVASVYEESNPPGFPFAESAEQYRALEEELLYLNARIAVTNAVTKLPSGVTLAEAIATLNSLKSTIALYRSLAFLPAKRKETKDKDRSFVDGKLVETVEIKIEISSMTEKECDAYIRGLESSFDSVNGQIESVNQTTKLVELSA